MNRIFLLLCAWVPTIALSAEVPSSAGPISSDYMAKLLLSLGLVVVIIFALAWLVKRFNVIPQNSHNLIKVISTLSVGSRDRLALIQVGEEQLLIALTPGKISKLHRLEQPIETQDKTQSSFKSKFDSVLQKKDIPTQDLSKQKSDHE